MGQLEKAVTGAGKTDSPLVVAESAPPVPLHALAMGSVDFVSLDKASSGATKIQPIRLAGAMTGAANPDYHLTRINKLTRIT